MSTRYLACTAVTVALVGAAATASAEQFVLVDQTFTFTTADTDAHHYLKPLAGVPRNWTTPVDYMGGVIHIHLEVLTKPSNATTSIVPCLEGKNVNNAYSYVCMWFGPKNTATGIFDWSNTSLDDNHYVDWSKGINSVAAILDEAVNGSLIKVDPRKFGADVLARFYPSQVRIVITVVSKGGTYIPPGAPMIADAGDARPATEDGPRGDVARPAVAAASPSDAAAVADAASPPTTKPPGAMDDPAKDDSGSAPAPAIKGAGCSIGAGAGPHAPAVLLLAGILVFWTKRKRASNVVMGPSRSI